MNPEDVTQATVPNTGIVATSSSPAVETKPSPFRGSVQSLLRYTAPPLKLTKNEQRRKDLAQVPVASPVFRRELTDEEKAAEQKRRAELQARAHRRERMGRAIAAALAPFYQRARKAIM